MFEGGRRRWIPNEVWKRLIKIAVVKSQCTSVFCSHRPGEMRRQTAVEIASSRFSHTVPRTDLASIFVLGRIGIYLVHFLKIQQQSTFRGSPEPDYWFTYSWTACFTFAMCVSQYITVLHVAAVDFQMWHSSHGPTVRQNHINGKSVHGKIVFCLQNTYELWVWIVVLKR